jgi:pyrimidine deaminase RibD-like protein
MHLFDLFEDPQVVNEKIGPGVGQELELMLAGKKPAALVEDSGENDLFAAYDKILIDLCNGIVKHQKQNSDRYGLVAAAVVDPDHNVVYGINHKLASGKRVHAERAAMANYIKRHGVIPKNSIIITTLSPCTDDMPDRKGPSCTELLNGSPITRVYAGYRDPSQTHLSHDEFDVVYTQNSKIESVCKQIADCFLKESAYTDPANYRSEGVAEGVPQPGPSSGAPKQFGPDAKIQTRQMTVKDIISSVPGVPYYNNVVDDWDAKDYSWGVTKKVIEYATYLKDHPESLSKLPPAIVLNGKFEDGAHRVSAIWLLQQRMDPKNPLWTNAKLNVQFVKQGVAEAFDNPYKTKTEKSDYGDVDMLAKLPDGTNLSIMFNNQGDDEWQVEFYRNNSQEVTGEGDAQRVFATVLASMQKFIKKYKPWRLTFSATKLLDPTIYYEPDQPVPNPESRAKLYNRLVQRYATAWGYEEYAEDHGDQITYELTRLKPGMAEGATKIHSDKEPKLTGFSFQQLDSLCESAGSDYVKFDRAIKKNLVLPAWTNTLELYGVYARKLNEVKSKTLAEGTQSDIEQQLFDQLSQRALGNIDSASVGDRVSLLHLATLNIPGHKVVAKLNGFLTPKQIVKIVNTGRFQQLEFADGSRYPEKDGGDIFQQAQTWNMTKLFPSADAASKAFMFYMLEGQKLSDVLDFQTNVEQGVAENFADGKNPGRKGLSKRMGVNTKASVSSLRKTAKHSTGEKARMAHWLANMKAGKAKKK